MTRRTTILASGIAGVVITSSAFMLADYSKYAQYAHWFRLLGRALLLLPVYPVLIVGWICGVQVESTPFGHQLVSTPWLAIWDSLVYGGAVLLIAVVVRRILRIRKGQPRQAD